MMENILKEIRAQKTTITKLLKKLISTIDINEEITINNSLKIQCDILSILLNKKFLNININLNKAKQKLNNQLLKQKEQNLNDTIVVYFNKENKLPITVLCKKNEYIKDIIIKYRKISDDHENFEEFILNSKALNDSLTIGQSDIVQFSNIYVIPFQNKNFYNSSLPIDNYFYFKKYIGHLYDIIIKINSLRDLNKGWEIIFSELGEKTYNIMKNQEKLIVGVVGNRIKGKTFLLSKLSKECLPIGIETQGICIKYTTKKEGKLSNYIILDSAGSENALLENDKFNNTNFLSIDDEIKKLNLMISEQILIDYFIQSFVIKKSNILIVVLGLLNYHEQKFLYRIKNEHKNKYGNPPIYVVHNLQNFSLKKQVNDYIEEVLFKSATFKLKKMEYLSLNYKKDKNTVYFIEEFGNKEEKNTIIYHLILAKHNTEAGDYYNPLTFDFLREQLISCPIHHKFPIIEDIKQEFLINSYKIMKYSKEYLNVLENSDFEIKLTSKSQEKNSKFNF